MFGIKDRALSFAAKAYKSAIGGEHGLAKAPIHSKIGLGLGVTSLGLSINNYHVNKNKLDLDKQKNSIDKKSLSALQKIHAALITQKT